MPLRNGVVNPAMLHPITGEPRKLTILSNFVVAIIVFVLRVIDDLLRRVLPVRITAKDITGEVVLITGAGLGVGRAMAIKFAQKGAKIAALDINPDNLEETKQLVQKFSGTISTYVCDVTDRNLVYETVDRVKREMGTVNILVNNAGIVAGKRFIETPDALIERTVNVNAVSHFWLLKAVLPNMMASNHGHIVTIGSLASYMSVPSLVDYCASKAAALAISQALQAELLADHYDGIKITNVCPYFIDTGMFHGVHTGFLPLLKTDYVAEEAVNATITNQSHIILPYFLSVFPIIKPLIPQRPLLMLLDALSLSKSMVTFAPEDRHTKKYY